MIVEPKSLTPLVPKPTNIVWAENSIPYKFDHNQDKIIYQLLQNKFGYTHLCMAEG